MTVFSSVVEYFYQRLAKIFQNS